MPRASSAGVLVAALALAACDGARIAAPAVAPDAGPAIRARRDPRPPALPTPPDGGPVGLVPIPFPVDTVLELP
ncbi:MAG: hypothetical protein AVDCRST_MAG11-538 [uncultured Gemmatimonadaceae bacterium]|uniref:Uncharacterized protein n=1 Tax=uncultured Gemmatimonadaceae bacterium TaxID=246130 RepID=A0A6J4K5Z7_9BACT|nr:MAG: hypothetical protein AVDCRST_MAG11-538 [uncultured Gemmatimonadaceae bacterium]